MKRDLSFGSFMTTITASLFALMVSISPAFLCFANSANGRGEITHPEFLVGAVGGALLIVLGLVTIILSIIGIFKKRRGLAITILVFQALLFVSSILAIAGGTNLVNSLDQEELVMFGLQAVLPFAALLLSYAGAFVLNLFNVIKMKKQPVEVKEVETKETENV